MYIVKFEGTMQLSVSGRPRYWARPPVEPSPVDSIGTVVSILQECVKLESTLILYCGHHCSKMWRLISVMPFLFASTRSQFCVRNYSLVDSSMEITLIYIHVHSFWL